MSFVDVLVMFVFMLLPTLYSCSAETRGDYVRDACSVTKYPDICIHSLASFANTARQNPVLWARASVSVTLSEATNASQYLMKLGKCNSMRGRNRIALSDCIVCFQDAIDNLHDSLNVLRSLTRETFDSKIGDVTTWVSGALTDQDTCLDGFDNVQNIRQVTLVQNVVTNVTYVTSNALALVNKLATAGPESLINLHW
ncbi:hypothetical protein RJ639_045520 [Escallonia herrerae]|uniref:Pectinesterase inhibitor domain-containing protein n=1 Tax=Escallonia herrerae TaxID=1293975 RepID=A0AA88W6Q4_9ASTE|nr:hypothetical protein RJ639_045520 [Escallonia herrerae]